MNGLIITLKVDLTMFIRKSFTSHEFLCLHELIVFRISFTVTGRKNIEFKFSGTHSFRYTLTFMGDCNFTC